MRGLIARRRYNATMALRSYTLIDRFLGEIDKAIKVLTTPPVAARPLPRAGSGEFVQGPDEQLRSRRLMRVNHAGEVAAQALYRGQAATARDPEVRAVLHRVAAEEQDHLAWCALRLEALGGRTSLLNPLWYAGSFAIGALAGLRGDRASLGFITETERQVEAHLTDHLEQLPQADHASRAVLEQMQLDETRHGETATALGGQELPEQFKRAMRLTSRLMTHGSYWI